MKEKRVEEKAKTEHSSDADGDCQGRPRIHWHDMRMSSQSALLEKVMHNGFPIVIAAAVWLALPIAVLAEDAMDQKPIDEANAKLEALQKAGDAAGMAEMYTENAILLPAGGPRTEGREAIEAFWEELLGSGVEDVQLTTEDLVPVADDLAYEIGRYTATPADADPVSGQYLVLWKRVDGGWKLHVDIFNENRKAR